MSPFHIILFYLFNLIHQISKYEPIEIRVGAAINDKKKYTKQTENPEPLLYLKHMGAKPLVGAKPPGFMWLVYMSKKLNLLHS